MRLRKVKLAGFKSFVDPTVITFPGELTGIVGPNGCGKSNVIDAVRWVMGEISAKHLRGDSMADVVFNGSSARKPVSQASVELVFDNSEGLLGGRWASYPEISVRRQVARESQSVYYLNGVRCRRKDVTEIFMGTGLGPRSYAIIEQGMISRLIEAKPDELREFLEEAAGISKYKERRRETENRIRHTQENLERLNDVREEIDKRLQHLQRQARTAERYKELKGEERLLRAQLLALRWRALQAEAEQRGARIAGEETALEAALAEQRGVETRLEQARQSHQSAQDTFNEVYRQVLDVGTEIARIEETIQNQRERREQMRESLAREERSLSEARESLEAERGALGELEARLAREEPELERLREAEARVRAEFERHEQTLAAMQTAWEGFSARAGDPARHAHAERARIEHLAQQVAQLRERLTRLREEHETLSGDEREREVASLRAELEQEEAHQRERQAALEAEREEMQRLRERIDEQAEILDGLRARDQEMRGRLASLRALQEAALGKRSRAASEWLERHRLHEAPRLAEALEVEPGWERAVELVLGFHLEAVCVTAAHERASTLAELGAGSLGLVDAVPRTAAPAPARHLLQKVRGPLALDALLAGVRAAETLDEALTLREQLDSGESVVTRDGMWLGAGWARVAREPESEHGGVLIREGEMRGLAHALDELERDAAVAEAELAERRAALRALEESHAERQARHAEAHRHYAGLRAKLGASEAQLEQARSRRRAVETEIAELEAQVAAERSELEDARRRLQHAAGQMERLAGWRESFEERRRGQRARVESARERWRGLRDRVYQSGLRIESMRAQVASRRTALASGAEQVARLEGRCREAREGIDAAVAPLAELERSLNDKLETRRAREAELARAREAVESLQAELRRLERERHEREAAAQAQRQRVEELRVANQETLVRRQTVLEQLGEAGHALEGLLEALPEAADPQEWEGRLEALERRIERLGPINLAAIDELEQQRERKRYLDSQHEDLTQALATLEEAIHKIDRETRTRFRETYEKVNASLAATFPRLFGGGRAYLQMTGEDLLSTGIAVMAQPPGKRNSTIHLLSGGEKALTAVALVFAIFELNPAPFCLLDEVDAPLDDANVGRFCELVKDMSERVQFVLVTHNKTTMEMTHQLIGVTMNEPGVSRLVAVDVDEAAEMAAV